MLKHINLVLGLVLGFEGQVLGLGLAVRVRYLDLCLALRVECLDLDLGLKCLLTTLLQCKNSKVTQVIQV